MILKFMFVFNVWYTKYNIYSNNRFQNVRIDPCSENKYGYPPKKLDPSDQIIWNFKWLVLIISRTELPFEYYQVLEEHPIYTLRKTGNVDSYI